MVVFLLRIRPISKKRGLLLDVLRSVQRHTMLTSGCLECRIFEESAEEKATVLYLERWESLAALDRHIRSSLYLRLLHAIDLADDPPGISFYEVSEERGLELIQELRK